MTEFAGDNVASFWAYWAEKTGNPAYAAAAAAAAAAPTYAAKIVAAARAAGLADSPA